MRLQLSDQSTIFLHIVPLVGNYNKPINGLLLKQIVSKCYVGYYSIISHQITRYRICSMRTKRTQIDIRIGCVGHHGKKNPKTKTRNLGNQLRL